MRLTSILTPLSEYNLALAAQCGVTDIVARYPRERLSELQDAAALIRRFGLSVPGVEGYLPMDRIKFGQDDGTDLRAMLDLISLMGDLGIPVLCYNFMAGTDWVRTETRTLERGGAWVTSFRLASVHAAQALNTTVNSAVRVGASELAATASPQSPESRPQSFPGVTTPQVWESLERFLNNILPHAEKNGVTLAMHPDDPPLPQMLGNARIMNTVASFERLLGLAPSPSNGICFCQGTFAAMGVDVVATIHRLAPAIRYVHFRDVRGTPDDFAETFHDNGPTDMVAAMQAYRDIGFSGAIRPDHVPQLAGEEDGEPGYTMLGRLFAFGYLRGLLQATEYRARDTF